MANDRRADPDGVGLRRAGDGGGARRADRARPAVGDDRRVRASIAGTRDAAGRRGAGRGVKVFVVGAGAAAHLAGVVAAHTTLPVIGVPIDSSALKGLDALLSTVQMPPGVPVATVAIGKPGATNAGVLAAQMIALGDPQLAARLTAYKEKLEEKVEAAAAARSPAETRQNSNSEPAALLNSNSAESRASQVPHSLAAVSCRVPPSRCAASACRPRRAAGRTRRGCRGRGSGAPRRSGRGRRGSSQTR